MSSGAETGGALAALGLTRARARALAVAYAAAAVVLALSAGLTLAIGRDFAFVAREPAAALKDEDCRGLDCAAAGFLSNAGVLTWGTGAVLALGAAWLLRRHSAAAAAATLGFGAIVTAVLALDDMYLVHDYVAPRFLGLTAGQLAFYALYAALGGAFLLRLRRHPAGRTTPLFLAAGALLVVSAGLDLAYEESYVAEDSFKLLGIVTWTGALLFTAQDMLERDAPGVLGRSTG